MNGSRLAVLVPLLFLGSCSRRVPKATVDVIDTSMSITPRAERGALDALGDQILHLGRGDTLIVVPITGNAENDSGGRVLRLSAPTNREPYDADLHRFQQDAQKRLAVWRASLGLHQRRTDILGALDVAAQEIASLPKGSQKQLLVASDFIEDDDRFRFASDRALANPERAQALAAKIRGERQFDLHDVPVCLGRLESNDAASLPPRRREAIDAFWTAYLGNASKALIQFDAIGMLTSGGSNCANRMSNDKPGTRILNQ